MKKVSIYSFATLVALVSIGCGGSNGDAGTPTIVQKNSQAATVSGLSNLKSSSNMDRLSEGSDVKNSFDTVGEIDTYPSDDDTLCTSGKIDYTADEPSKTMTMNADKCFDGSSTLDGAVSVKFEGNDESPTAGTATVTRNISLTDTDNNSFLLDKGATLNVVLTEAGAKKYIDVETTFKSKVNGVIINASAVKVKITDENDKSIVNVKSGEFNIGSYYFKIDESKNNTITDNGGTIHMTDGAGHKVELVTENASVKLKVDENGDGTFSDAETLELSQ